MLNEIEERILSMLLEGDDPRLETLRSQREHLVGVRREHSGVGVFTHLTLAEGAPRLERPANLVLSDVIIELEGLEHLVWCMLFVNGGVLDMLETCTNADDSWPEDPRLVRAYYFHNDPPGSSYVVETPRRDIAWALGDTR